jgi:hypothetical protein
LGRGLDRVANGFYAMFPEYVCSNILNPSFVYAAEAAFTDTMAFVVRQDN